MIGGVVLRTADSLCIKSSGLDLRTTLLVYDPKAVGSMPHQAAAGDLNGFVQPCGPRGAGDPDGIPKIFDDIHEPL